MNTTISAAESTKKKYGLHIMKFIIISTLIIIAFLFLYRIDMYPAPNYDEGAHLHVAKNFAVNGVYADYSSEGNRPYGPSLGSGPALLLIIGLAYKVFGVSIVLARLIVALYSVGTAICIYLLGTRLMNWRAGIVASLIMVLTPGLNLTFFARSVMGEVPGLFFVVTGILLWISSEEKHTFRLIYTGILFGLASTTKNQYAMVVLPSLVITWVADIVWYRRHNWRYYVIPGVVAGIIYFAWLYFILFVISNPDGSATVTALQGTSSYAFFVWKIQDAFAYLISRSVYGGLFIPALIFCIFVSRERNEKAQNWGLITIFAVMATLFYLSSLAWPRYAFLAVGIGSLLVTRLLYSLTNRFLPTWSGVQSWRSINRLFWPLVNSLAFVLVIISVMWWIFIYIRDWQVSSMQDAYDTAAYLETHVPKNIIIETWEEELAVLTDHIYHYPPAFVDVELGKAQVLGTKTDVREKYNFRDYTNAEYVVVGPIGDWTELYPLNRLKDFNLLETFGNYRIYKQG